jgi:hypothetical protein
MAIKEWAARVMGKKAAAPLPPLAHDATAANRWNKVRADAGAKSERAEQVRTADAHEAAAGAHREAAKAARAFGATGSMRQHEAKADAHEAKADEIRRDEKGRFASK